MEPRSDRRLLVIGLDGTTPEFLFERMRPVMPNLGRLIDRGQRAALRTTDPPLSIPAWPVMFTGVDPGTLGVYGFRHRRPASYEGSYVPTSRDLPVPTVWQVLSERGYRLAVMGMPLGYPPPPINGVYISDFLTPSGARDYTYPPSIRDEIEARFGPYPFDVVFRSNERVELFQEMLRMLRVHFDVAEWLYQTEPWDVFAIQDIGTDRLHHAYWKYFDRTHPRFEKGNPFENVDREYYAALDAAIGRLLRHTDERTMVLLTSDHGSMAMDGCFCINQWLEEKGYLVLRRAPPAAGTTLEKVDVDWHRTTAWGAGGYYARIFFNVRGRELHGVVPADRVASVRQQLIRDLSTITTPKGDAMPVEVLDPRERYATVRGDAPDLMVYLGDLKWRSAGTMGHPSLFLEENDIGPDDAVHSREGVFLFYDPENPIGLDRPTLQIRDIMPTILDLLGEPVPDHVQGIPIPGLRLAAPPPHPHGGPSSPQPEPATAQP